MTLLRLALAALAVASALTGDLQHLAPTLATVYAREGKAHTSLRMFSRQPRGDEDLATPGDRRAKVSATWSEDHAGGERSVTAIPSCGLGNFAAR